MAQPKSDIERITHRPRILSLLQRIRDARTMIMVHFGKDSSSYNSAILEIDDDKETMTLDEINTREGHDRLVENKTFFANARLGGVNVRFKTTLQDVEQEDGTYKYQVAIPTIVHYEQRRAAFRVRVGAGIMIPVTICDEEKNCIDGELFDISNTGVGAMVPGDSDIQKDGKNYFCKVTMPEGDQISGELEIRFLKEDGKLRQLLVGGEFINMNGPQRNALERSVMSLQREVIKRSRKA
jgi:c-di-GMP-binding flagellar brake protein YcgR